MLAGGEPSPHKIAGIGAGFIPGLFDRTLLDGLRQGTLGEIVPVHSDDALAMGRRLPREEGLLVGISSGATVHAALELARRSEMAGKTIVAMAASSGERYLSTALFAPVLSATAGPV